MVTSKWKKKDHRLAWNVPLHGSISYAQEINKLNYPHLS